MRSRFPARRQITAAFRRSHERLDRLALILTIAYVAAIGAAGRLPITASVSVGLDRLTLALDALLVLTIAAYWLLRFLLLRDPNRQWLPVLTPQECKLIRGVLFSGPSTATLTTKCKFKFAAQNDIAVLSELNFKAFTGSDFELDELSLRRRNAAFIARHPRCFMLMIDPLDGTEYIGYSAVLPLNETGRQLYLEGGVKDATLPPGLLAGPDETPAALLLFAIHLRPAYSFSRCGASRKYSFYFWSCIRLHCVLMHPQIGQSQPLPPIYAQTASRSLARKLLRIGFSVTGHQSADGFPIYGFSAVDAPPLVERPMQAPVAEGVTT